MRPTLRAIAAAEARPLRHAILRPNQSLAELVYPDDDAADTLHAGAFEGDALVGVASVYREAPPGERDERAWRLRGMGTLPNARRAGGGRVGYASETLQLSSGVEYRFDEAEQLDGTWSERKTWLFRNSFKLQMTPDWRLLGKFNHSYDHPPPG